MRNKKYFKKLTYINHNYIHIWFDDNKSIPTSLKFSVPLLASIITSKVPLPALTYGWFEWNNRNVRITMYNGGFLLREKGLQIIILCNLKIADYLDVKLNLNDGAYRPFHKLNEETTYIHVQSNHLPQTLKKIPRTIEKRLSYWSSTKRIFENSNSTMSSVKSKGYLQKINYTKENDGTNSKSWKCNILRFYTANQPKLMSVNFSFG